MHLKVLATLLIFCLTQFDDALGLKCYACVQSGTDGDRRCEKDPKAVPNSAINCNKKYCVIRRIEYVDKPGSVFSFYRGCEQRPDYINSEITDDQFKTYYRSCTTNICNDGDGRTGGGGGGGINSDGNDDGGAILVPGLGGGAAQAKTTLLVIALSSLFAFMMQNYL